MSKDIQKVDKVGLIQSNKKKLDLSTINTGALSASLSELSIPRLFYQLVIFVIDGSNSMHGKTSNNISKAEEIDKSIRLIVRRLKESKNSNSFDISFVPFSDDFDRCYGIKNIKDIKLQDSFNPFDYIEQPKGTYLEKAFCYIEQISEEYLNCNIDKNAQVLIQILSDGAIDDFAKTQDKMNKIKENEKITIACQFIESEIDENLQYYSWDESTGKIDRDSKWTIEEVKQSRIRVSNKFKTLATSDDLFITSANPEEIRKHMIKSISTVSKID
jgi:hypothetical protein